MSTVRPTVKRARHDAVTVSVVRRLDELMEVMAVRSLVYMGDQQCPYEEEFDGNDLNATHLIARAGREPIGAMRIRWFGEFAKFERIAIRGGHRDGEAVRLLMKAALELSARKGFRKVIGHIQSRLLPFWRRTALMYERPGRPRVVFSDLEYVEVERDLEPHPDVVGLDSPPQVLLRPEGDWDRAGVLDRSAMRGAKGQAGRAP